MHFSGEGSPQLLSDLQRNLNLKERLRTIPVRVIIIREALSHHYISWNPVSRSLSALVPENASPHPKAYTKNHVEKISHPV